MPSESGTACQARSPVLGSNTQTIAVTGAPPFEVTIGPPTPGEEDAFVEPTNVKTGAPLLLTLNR